jgi:hypothetical protein
MLGHRRASVRLSGCATTTTFHGPAICFSTVLRLKSAPAQMKNKQQKMQTD